MTKSKINLKLFKIILAILLVFLLVPAGALTQVNTAFADSDNTAQSDDGAIDNNALNDSNDSVQENANEAEDNESEENESSATAWTNESEFKKGTGGESKITYNAEWSNKSESGEIQAYDTANLNVNFQSNASSDSVAGDGEFYIFFLDVSGSMFEANRWEYMTSLVENIVEKTIDRNPNARFGFQCYTCGAEGENNSYDKSGDYGPYGFWPITGDSSTDFNFIWNKKVTGKKSIYQKANALTMYIPFMVTFRSFLNWYLFNRLDKTDVSIHSIWITDGTAPKTEQTETKIVENMISSKLIDYMHPEGYSFTSCSKTRNVKGDFTILQVMNGSTLSQWCSAVINKNKRTVDGNYGYQFGNYLTVTDTSDVAIGNDAAALSRPVNSKELENSKLTVTIDKDNFAIDDTKEIEMPGFDAEVDYTNQVVTFTPTAGTPIYAGTSYSAKIPLIAKKYAGTLDVNVASSTNLTYTFNDNSKKTTDAKVDLEIPTTESHSVTYSANSGGGASLPTEASYPPGTNVTVASGSGLGKKIEGTDRVGAFGGWLMSYGSEQKVVTEGSTFSMPPSDVTLTALYSDLGIDLDASSGSMGTYILKDNTSATATKGILETALENSESGVTASQVSEISFTKNSTPSSFYKQISIYDDSEGSESNPFYMYLIADGSNYKIQVDAPDTIKCKTNSLVALFGGTYSSGTPSNGFVNCSKVDIQNLDTSGTTSAYRMFCNLGKLLSGTTTISLPEAGLDTSSATNMSFLLANSNIQSFDFTKISTDAATNLERFLSYCTKIETIDLTSLNTSSNQYADSMFYNCSSLESISFPTNFITSSCCSLSYLFYGCSKITTINVVDWAVGSNITKSYGLDYVFYNCSSLTTIISSDDANWKKYTSGDGTKMFYGCKSLIATYGTGSSKKTMPYNSSFTSKTSALVFNGQYDVYYFTSEKYVTESDNLTNPDSASGNLLLNSDKAYADSAISRDNETAASSANINAQNDVIDNFISSITNFFSTIFSPNNAYAEEQKLDESESSKLSSSNGSTIDKGLIKTGDAVKYYIKVTNDGDYGSITNDAQVTDKVPAGMKITSNAVAGAVSWQDSSSVPTYATLTGYVDNISTSLTEEGTVSFNVHNLAGQAQITVTLDVEVTKDATSQGVTTMYYTDVANYTHNVVFGNSSDYYPTKSGSSNKVRHHSGSVPTTLYTVSYKNVGSDLTEAAVPVGVPSAPDSETHGSGDVVTLPTIAESDAYNAPTFYINGSTVTGSFTVTEDTEVLISYTAKTVTVPTKYKVDYGAFGLNTSGETPAVSSSECPTNPPSVLSCEVTEGGRVTIPTGLTLDKYHNIYDENKPSSASEISEVFRKSVSVELYNNTTKVGDVTLSDTDLLQGWFTTPSSASAYTNIKVNTAWERKTFTVEYKFSNTGPEISLPDSTSVKWNDSFTIADVLAAEGYAFEGWTSDHNLKVAKTSENNQLMDSNNVLLSSNESNEEKTNYIMPSDNVVMSGSWTLNDSSTLYSVEVENGQASINGADFSEKYENNVSEGDAIYVKPVCPSSITEPDGYECKSLTLQYLDSEVEISTSAEFIKDESGNYSITMPSMTDSSETKHTGLKVICNWGLKTPNVTFDANGGAWVGTTTETTKVIGQTYNSKYDLPDTNPTFVGYSFVGWYTDKTTGSEVTSDTDMKNPSAHTLYAHWTPNKYTLTINYKYTDGSTAATTVTKEVDFGSEYSVASPSITGYTADKLEVAGVMLAKDETVEVTYSNITFTVTINYKNRLGETTIKTDTTSVNYGSSFSKDKSTFPTYTDKELEENTTSISLTNITSNQEINIFYVYTTLGFDLTGYSGVYDGDSHSVEVDHLVPEGVKVKYKYSEDGGTTWSETNREYTNYTNGDKTVTVKAEATGYKSVTKSATVNIKQREITLSITDESRIKHTYDGNDFVVDFDKSDWSLTSGTGNAFVNDDKIEGTATTSSPDYGSYTFGGTQKYLIYSEDSTKTSYNPNNYKITKSVTLTIEKATISVKTLSAASKNQKTYDGNVFVCSSDEEGAIEITGESTKDTVAVKLTTNDYNVATYNEFNSTTSPINNGYYAEILVNGKNIATETDANYTVPKAADFTVQLEIIKAKITSNITKSVDYNAGNPVTLTYLGTSSSISGIAECDKSSISIEFTTSGGVADTYETGKEKYVASTITFDPTTLSSNYENDLYAKIIINEETVNLYEVTFDCEKIGSTTPGKVSIDSTKVKENTKYSINLSGEDLNKVVFTDGTEATVSATANEGYEFDYWKLNGAKVEESTKSGSITAKTTFTAVFKVKANPKFTISKTADVSTAKIGDKIKYTITVNNTGNVELTNITVTDQLLWGDKVYTINSLASGGSVTIPETGKSEGYPTEYTVQSSDFETGTNVVENIAKASWNETESTATSKTTLQLTETPVPTPVGSELIYNGDTQIGVEEATGAGYTLEDNQAKNAGEYEAKATLKPGYIWKDISSKDVQKVSWKIWPKSVTVKSVSTFTFSGDKATHKFDTTKYTTDTIEGLVDSATINSEKSIFSTNSKNVKYDTNNNVVAYTKNSAQGTGEVEGEITWNDEESITNYSVVYDVSMTINPKSFDTDPEDPNPVEISIDGGGKYTYNDTKYTPTITVKYNDQELKLEDGEYYLDGDTSATEANKTDKPKYTVVVKGSKNYTGSRGIDWYINPKVLNITTQDKETTYNLDYQTLDVDKTRFVGLCEDHRIVQESITFNKSEINQGTYTGLTVDSSKLLVVKGEGLNISSIALSNYKPTATNSSTLKITPYNITIQVKGHYKAYDYNRSVRSVSGYDIALKDDAAGTDAPYYVAKYVSGPDQDSIKVEATDVKRGDKGSILTYAMEIPLNKFSYTDPLGNVVADFEKEDGWLLINPLGLGNAEIILGEVVRSTDTHSPVTQNIDSVKVKLAEDGSYVDVYPQDYIVADNEKSEPGNYTLTISATKDSQGYENGNFTGSNNKPWILLGQEDEDIPKTNGSVDFEFTSVEGAPVSTLHESKCDMIENTVSADELSTVCTGTSVKVDMKVEDATSSISQESKALFEAAMSKNSQKLGQYVDINIKKSKTPGTTTDVHDIVNSASITMEIPESLIPGEGVERNFYILRNHDGVISDLGATYDTEAQTLTFSSDKYSDYAIAYRDGEEPVPPTPDPPTPTPDPSPASDDTVNALGSGASSSTADNIALGILAGLLVVIATAGFVISRSKRKVN